METHEIEKFKRSKEPIFWGMFGFGGMVIAFAMPALLICMIIAGLSDGHQNFHILEVMKHWWGALALLLIIFGTAFHCVHRIIFSIHDFKVHIGTFVKVLFYGFATLILIAAGVGLLMYYLATITA